jgi:dolichol-phosphate mannosyltransferase
MITHVVLPAYNEAEAILPLLERFWRQIENCLNPINVIVVDDGSSDGTADCAGAFQGVPLEILRHRENRGLSEATKTGLLAAVERAAPYDIIILMDADDTHSPGLINRMVRLIEEGNDVVIASRYVRGARIIGVPLHRQLLSLGASWLFRLTYPIRGVKDYTCGYRAYRAGLLQEAFARWGDSFISEPGFSCMVDILLKLDELNAIMTEVPLILRYDRKPGKSKMDVRRTVRQTLWLMLRRRFGFLGRRAADQTSTESLVEATQQSQ